MPIITPITNAPATSETPTPVQSARERAIAKFNNSGAVNQSQPSPVLNPTNVSPEELSVVRPPQATETTEENALATASDAIQPDTSEAPKVDEVTPKPEEKQPLSAQYAQLARKEKAIRAQAVEVKAQMADIAAREAAIKAKESEYASNFVPKSKLLEDTVGTLNELGIGYDTLTQQELNAPSPEIRALQSTIKALEAKITAIETDTKGTKDSLEQRDKQSYQQALGMIKRDINNLVDSDPEFETIKATNSMQDVVDLIEGTFKEEGYLMTVEEAAKAVEDHLAEEIAKYSKLKKIQARLAPAVKTPAATPPAPKQTQSNPVKTLTNDMGAAPKLSVRERAILAFQNKLNK